MSATEGVAFQGCCLLLAGHCGEGSDEERVFVRDVGMGTGGGGSFSHSTGVAD